jgi:uncharacterized protein HemX
MDNDADTAPAPKRRTRRRAPVSDKPSRSGRFAAGLALVLALVAVLASAYVGWLVNSKRGLTDAKGRLFQVEKETAQLQELSTQMNRELGTLRETQEMLKSGVQALHGEIGKGRRAWLIAETGNLLVIAQQRLTYARDPRQALEALRAADRQLQQLGDPSYQPVRKLLAGEIGALESFERLDPRGMARRLGLLAGRVDTLPLAPLAPTEPAAAAAESGFAREVWKDLRDLVRIRTTTDVRRPLLLPEHKFFLRENLRLMLYGAQVALLHGDIVTLELNARAALKWLRDYYDGNAGSVQTATAELEATLKTRLAELPDISASLKTLRELNARPNAP